MRPGTSLTRSRATTLTALAAGPAAGALALLAAAPASAVVRPVSAPHVIAAFAPAPSGEQPENMADAGGGFADVTLNMAGRVVRIGPDGQPRAVLAQLPAGARAMGINRTAQGRLYISVGGKDPGLSGIWLVESGSARRVAALPVGFPNGLASSPDGTLYVADSMTGTISRLAPGASEVTVWATGGDLVPSSSFGVNGLRWHQGALYASVTDRGLLLRIPLGADGGAGAPQVKAKGLDGIDDFAFAPSGGTVVAALNSKDSVVMVSPSGKQFPVLSASDGLSSPTSVLVGRSTLSVASAAYSRGYDPNVIGARLAPLPPAVRG